MVFYRVHRRNADGCSEGYSWFTSEREALKNVDDPYYQPEKIEVTPTKRGIYAALRIYAAHPDNG